MTDSYLGISQIANDDLMFQRMQACTTQQAHLGNADIADVASWVSINRYLWASSPSWAEKWDSALALHPDDPEYQPGADPAVITDADILSTVQALAPAPPSDPSEPVVTPHDEAS